MGRTEYVRVFAYKFTICNKMLVKNDLNKKLFEVDANQKKKLLINIIIYYNTLFIFQQYYIISIY